VPTDAEDGPARRAGRLSRVTRVPEGSSELRHAVPLAVAAALVGVVSLLTTVFVAHVLTTREYGTLIVLLGLFLVISQPGTAVLVGVVRRISAWQAAGLGGRVRPWVARVHRMGEISIIGLALVMWLIRVPVANALSLRGPDGVAEILTAGGVWILVSIDRGLLQVSRDYTDLSVNLVIEATMRCALTVGLAAELGVEGAALGLLSAELITAVHARFTGMRAMERSTEEAARPPAPAVSVAPPDPVVVAQEEEALEQAVGDEGAGAVVATAVHGGKDLLADVLVALGSLLLLALLQNIDVIVLGSKMPSHRGSYAAISVPSKALVFVALVLVNYLLPEATIRHQRGSNALRQLGHTFAVLAIPCFVLLGLAVVAPRQLLTVVFGHRYTAAAPEFSTLVLAMVFLSVTVALTVYLLGIGYRWVVVVLAVGAGALAAASLAANGQYAATARADLAVQVGLCAAMAVSFVVVHRRAAGRRARAGNASEPPSQSLA
jgi:O-antigen/teichoic acid export membrane protein